MLAEILKRRETVLGIITLIALITIGVLMYTEKLKPSVAYITGGVIIAVATSAIVYENINKTTKASDATSQIKNQQI